MAARPRKRARSLIWIALALIVLATRNPALPNNIRDVENAIRLDLNVPLRKTYYGENLVNPYHVPRN
jgi:hypothetical protein